MKNEMVKVEHNDNVTNFVAMVERFATSPEVDVLKLEKIIELQERILNRNAKQGFAASLAKMQAELPEIAKDGEIKIKGTVQSKYAKFEDINEAVRPVLQRHGFAVTFRIKCDDNKIKISAILSHQLGHEESTEIILPHETTGNKNAVQAVGSTVSYGKRYTMCALLNITTRGEDDDGQASGQRPQNVQNIQAAPSAQSAQSAPKQNPKPDPKTKTIDERIDNAFNVLKVEDSQRVDLKQAYSTDLDMLLRLLSNVHLKKMTFVDLMSKARFILDAIQQEEKRHEKDVEVLFGDKK